MPWTVPAKKAPPSIAVFVGFLLLCLFIQRSADAWNTPFTAYPDEPSHFVGSVMVRDYFATGMFSNPLHFAQNYYREYPFFAVGYWPPLFYILTGICFLILGVGKFQALLLSAAAAAGMAWVLYLLVRARAGSIAGICAGLLFLSLPEVQLWMCAVMVDLTAGFFCMLAAVLVLRYLDQPTWGNAIFCGICCACAALSKYNGSYACAIPVAACVLLRRFSLLRQSSFWAMYAVIFLMVGPWIWWARKFSQMGLPSDQGSHFSSRIAPFLVEPFRLFPPVLAVAVTLGLIALLAIPSAWRSDVVVMGLLYAGCIGLLIFSPVLGPERRYLLVSGAALLALSFSGWAAALDRVTKWPWAMPALGLILILCMVPEGLRSAPAPQENLIREVVGTIARNPASAGKRIIVSPDLEGPIIAEFAIQDRHRPGYTLLRSNKLFADRNWMGDVYHSKVESPEEIAAYLKQNPVDFIIWHFQKSPEMAHQRMLEEMLKTHAPSWRSIAEFGPSQHPEWEVYRCAN